MTPLQGLQIIELAGILAGPSVGMFFAELGANVLKIENSRAGGDITRQWRTTAEKDGLSAYFASVNFQKNYVQKNLHNPDDLQEVKQLIASADVLLHNFKSGDDTKYGLDKQALFSLNPKLIVGIVKGFANQPNRVAYDVVAQAETGFMSINGFDKNQNNLKMPVALIDILAAHQLKEGLLLAMLQREKTGKGSVVSVSLEEAGIAALANQASNYLMTGVVPQAIGSRHPNIAPYGDTFYTSDGKPIVLAVGSDSQFAKLCAVLGISQFSNLDQFASNAARVMNRQALCDCLSLAIAKQNRDELLEKLHAMQVPAAAIKSIDEVFNSHTARQMIRTETIEGYFTQRVSGNAFTIEELS